MNFIEVLWAESRSALVYLGLKDVWLKVLPRCSKCGQSVWPDDKLDGGIVVPDTRRVCSLFTKPTSLWKIPNLV